MEQKKSEAQTDQDREKTTSDAEDRQIDRQIDNMAFLFDERIYHKLLRKNYCLLIAKIFDKFCIYECRVLIGQKWYELGCTPV